MDLQVLKACLTGSFDGSLSFPEVVRRLRAGGVERYHADLVQLRKTYYGTGGRAQMELLPLQQPPTIGDTFDEATVREALAAIQQRQIQYPEFLRRIMAAGTASYTVFLEGNRTLYGGRHGDFYLEMFPWAR